MSDATWKTISTVTAETFYVIIGLIFLLLALRVFKQAKDWKAQTTAAFWTILALIFIAGPHVPYWLSGLGILLITVLTAIKGVVPTTHVTATPAETRAKANKIGNKIFIPALTLAFAAFLVASLFKKLGANNAIGVAAIIALIIALVLTKAKPSESLDEGLRLLDNVGSVSILPQLLAALGALFTAAGVGNVISQGVTAIVPEGSRLIACAVYCIGMALFTIIMGNGFAAFSVITVGIGIPFLIANGANPVVVGALGLTAGYCGTLLTPMAANFNIMPAALLETKSKYAIIMAQLPFALVMLLIHIFLMYFFAFK